ncbi:rhodanese-like domain-containing protein [Xanthomonadaceae bacterium JHOS43]|nr:rhodanese-like domain-containing protein [Xanthomonadaceae bacterium JHOS43]
MNHRICLAFVFAAAVASPALAQQSFNQAPSYPSTPQQAPQSGHIGDYNTMPMQQQSVPQQQGGYPQQQDGHSPPGAGYAPAPAAPGYGTPQPHGGMGGANPFQAILQAEMQDYGVAPQAQLQTTLHGPTPTSIPGGQVITTDRLLSLYQQEQQAGLLVFHVLGPGPTLPMAQNAAPASQPGSFNDQTQREFGQYLQQVTQGNKAKPLVFYCQSTQCWMSYNAALRAINMGFTQVYWYRGGVEAWQQVQQLSASMSQQGGQMDAAGGYRNTGQNSGWR